VPPPTDTLETLQHVLASAAGIAQDLAGDPLLARLLDVFSRIPREDREAILGIIERECDLRNLSLQSPSSPLSGLNLTKPNPNARLYFRVAESHPVPYATPEEVVQAVIRAAQVVHRSAERGFDLMRAWGPVIREGFQRIPQAERQTLRGYHEAVLKLLDQAEPDSH
jgi:hypothetical protein